MAKFKAGDKVKLSDGSVSGVVIEADGDRIIVRTSGGRKEVWSKAVTAKKAEDSHAADSRRARLHRALDYALDRVVVGRDALDNKQFLDLMEKVGTLRSSTQSLQWPGNDNPRLQKASTDIYNATMSKVKQLIASSGVSPQEFRKRATKVASKVGRRINLNWIDSLDRH